MSRSTIVLLTAIAFPMSISCSSGDGWQDLESQVEAYHPRMAFRDSTGREIGKEELKSHAGAYRFTIEDRDSVPEEAIRLHARARDLGANGDYAGALGLLWKA